ncbi:cytochrome P450 [Colletotrichum somersetense]|nr:cytochrome P450 [Colletotrichum somersetense]
MALEIWRMGYEKVTEWLVLPIRFAEEPCKLPDDVIGIQKVGTLNFQSEYTYILANDPLMQSAIRLDLTPHLPQVVGGLSKEVARTVPENIIAIVSGYVFIGPELCRHPKFLDATKCFTRNAFGAAGELFPYKCIGSSITNFILKASLKQWPEILRWSAARFADARVVELRKQRANLIEFLTPYAPKFKMDTNAELTNVQAVLSIVAIETTTLATHFIFDCVAHCPEIIPKLRQEVRSVLEEDRGVYTAKALAQMKLIDLVVKESLRLLPKGVFVTTGLVNVVADETYYPEANSFNPYRFMDLRSGKTEDPLQYQNKELISVTKENMSLGFGRPSCPGRFFASNEIKVVMAELLTNYDVRLPDGVTERYKNIVNGDIARLY